MPWQLRRRWRGGAPVPLRRTSDIAQAIARRERARRDCHGARRGFRRGAAARSRDFGTVRSFAVSSTGSFPLASAEAGFAGYCCSVGAACKSWMFWVIGRKATTMFAIAAKSWPMACSNPPMPPTTAIEAARPARFGKSLRNSFHTSPATPPTSRPPTHAVAAAGATIRRPVVLR
jgi:hypothetical protein